VDEDERIEPDENDRDVSNVLFRAGYVRGLADKLPPGDERMFLLRAYRSLIAYAEALGAGAKLR
jgi:hypothetical protein